MTGNRHKAHEGRNSSTPAPNRACGPSMGSVVGGKPTEVGAAPRMLHEQ